MEDNLQDALVAANIPISNYRCDLYFPVTEESTAILERFYKLPSVSVSRFINKIEGGTWYDVFAAYVEKES